MLVATFLFILSVLFLFYIIFSIAIFHIYFIHFIFVMMIFTFAAHVCLFLLVYLCLIRR